MCLVLSFAIESGWDISMLFSEGFDVRLVAFRVVSGASLEYPAQTDGDVRALYEQHFVGGGCSVISMTRKNATFCCD